MLRNNRFTSIALALALYFCVEQIGLAATNCDELIDEGTRLELLRDYKASKKYFLQALDLALKADKNSSSVAECQARLASVCIAQKEIKEAEGYTKAALALAVAEKRAGHPNQEVTICMDFLATDYLDHAPDSEREYCYKKSIEICQTLFDVNNPMTSRGYGALATLYLEKGRYADAASIINKILAIANLSVGALHNVLTKNVIKLAASKYERGDIVAAEKMIQITEDIEVKKQSDRFRATRQQFQAIICSDKGDQKQAEQLFLRAVKQDEVKHPGTARLAVSYAQLARYYCQQHREKDADKYFDLARMTAIRSNSQNLESIVRDQNNCAHHKGVGVRPVFKVFVDY